MSEKTQMICDRVAQIDIRVAARSVGRLPGVIDFEGTRIETTSTPTNFGGTRQWFLCPDCGRRCAILYRPQRGAQWLCRRCGDGRYESELLSPHERRVLRAGRLRRRLGAPHAGLLAPIPDKPKRMRWTTYHRLVEDIRALEREIWPEEARRVGLLGPGRHMYRAEM